MLVRLHAQRLLVERADVSIVPGLVSLIEEPSVDSVGLNVGAIHALHTLHGLGQLRSDTSEVFQRVVKSLSHPSAGVRLNAVRVLPETQLSCDAIRQANLISDADHQVILAALLKISDSPRAEAGQWLAGELSNAVVAKDRWLTDALTSAGAMHAESFLAAVGSNADPLPASSLEVVRRVAQHFARSQPDAQAVEALLASSSTGHSETLGGIIAGLSLGWPKEHVISVGSSIDTVLVNVFGSLPDSGKASLARLAGYWSNRSLEKEIAPIISNLIDRLQDPDQPVDDRVIAAEELFTMDAGRPESADAVEQMIGPQSSPELSKNLIETLGRSKAAGLAQRYLRLNESASPDLRDAIVRVMLSRPELTRALLKAIEAGEMQMSDLSTEQRNSLTSNPAIEIRRLARDLLSKGGIVMENDRTKLVDAKMPLTKQTGDPDQGKAVFTKNCATCHVFKGEGNLVGPNLNGMSVHPKAELLTHILDPNRSVEANYRLYSVLTSDGVVISGLLSGESLTTLEMVDSQGKRHTILREDIDQLKPSTNSAMPEGFEQSIDDAGLVNLLEYLTQIERYVPLGLESVVNTSSAKGMFYNANSNQERLMLSQWGTQKFNEVPFSLLDPKSGEVNNVVMLHGPEGPMAPQRPKSVNIRCRAPAKTIHVLGGVAGWAAQKPGSGGVSMIVRLNYADGSPEDHPLVDGQHIADYIGDFEVPQSKLAFRTLDGGQIRYLSIEPKRSDRIESIDLIKPDHRTAPVIMAITIEIPSELQVH
jgi:uncharacterized protein